jgi:hypothetical protein
MQPEKRLAEQCFKKNRSNPPVCGVHNVPLVQNKISIDPNVPGLGHINCFRCPVSHAVVPDAEEF